MPKRDACENDSKKIVCTKFFLPHNGDSLLRHCLGFLPTFIYPRLGTYVQLRIMVLIILLEISPWPANSLSACLSLLLPSLVLLLVLWHKLLIRLLPLQSPHLSLSNQPSNKKSQPSGCSFLPIANRNASTHLH